MPTTRLKNTLYRALLPFLAPGCGPHPVSCQQGHEINHMHSFIRLIRRHHILGSATLLSSGDSSSLICTSSVNPCHSAFPETYFRVASITKTAVAVLVMRLADQGILSLDTPVSHYFSDKAAKHALNDITLTHLLSHTSGITDPPGMEEALECRRPFTDFFPSARQFKPGHSFHYSNLGFGIIGCVLESVLDNPVSDIFRIYLFEPLLMNATLEGSLLPENCIMPVSRILPWKKGSDMILTSLGSHPLLAPDPLRHYGHTAGSMYTDIFSLKKLLLVLTDNYSHFLKENSISAMKASHACYGPLSPTLSYGLGLLRINDSCLSDSCIYGHQGFAYGCVDGAFWEEKTGRIVIMLNGGCSEARDGRLGIANRDLLQWAFRKELPSW